MTFISDSGTNSPVFDYSSRDYASIYQDLVNRIPVYLPEWTSTSDSDFGHVLLQMFAYVGDLLSYYLDRLAGEAFIQTATQPSSVINLAAMLDYQPTLAVGAVTTLAITISSSVVGPVTFPAGTLFATTGSATQSPILFQTTAALTIAGAFSTTASVTGVVTAVQGVTYTSLPSADWVEFSVPASATAVPQLATSDGTVNQTYGFGYKPVSANSFNVYVDLGLGPQEWTYVQSLINSGPYDLVFSNFIDANGVFYVVFGDGVNGYVPPLGSPIYATYQVTVGELGNVGSNTIVNPVSALPGVTSVTNPTSATGGADAESLASIQQAAPASLKTLNRAVTVADFATLAQQVPGVQWASAEEQTYQLVNLYIAPFGGSVPSTLLQSQVLNYVSPLSMANTSISIYAPTYIPVNITIQINVLPTYGNMATQSAVQSALANLLSLANTGFGFRVALGLVYQTVLAQVGVEYAIITALNRQVMAQTTAITGTSPGVTSLSVTPLPQPVYAGDAIVLTDASGAHTQTLTATVSSAVGAAVVYVSSFTPNFNYPIGSSIQDTTGVNDCVFLPNEIPVAGTFTFSPPVSGGLIGS